MENKNPIQVADRIFQVLETLSATGPLGLIEISKEVDLNKTTVHRILNSLLYMGYVKQDPDTAKYSLSFKIWDIANQMLNRIDVVEIARPYLKQLAEETGETVHMVQIDGTDAVYIDKVESHLNSVRLVSRIGKRIPLYCSGVGKALLAELPDDRIEALWNESTIQKLTEHTIVDFSLFQKEIEKTRTYGYALDDEENELGVCCIAVSLEDYKKKNKYAFSISAPKSRMDEDRIKEISSAAISIKEKMADVWRS